MTFGFLIPAYVCSAESLYVFTGCITSLQRFHPTVPKVIFTDPSLPFDIAEMKFLIEDPTIRIIKTRYCDGEMNVFKHFHDTKYFDVGVLLHDSFQIKKPLANIEDVKDVRFIWYFTNHRVHWHIIEEPVTEYNTENNIKTHDDLILHLCKKSYEGTEFYSWLKNIYWKKKEWVGCFGPVTIISHDFLRTLEEKTKFLNIIPNIKNKRDRIAIETIYSLACQYALGRTPSSYDGLYYDGIHPNNGFESETFKKYILYRP